MSVYCVELFTKENDVCVCFVNHSLPFMAQPFTVVLYTARNPLDAVTVVVGLEMNTHVAVSSIISISSQTCYNVVV